MNPSQQSRVDAISRADIPTSPVKSSQIAEIGHDPKTNTLAVVFNARRERNERLGPKYHYGDVDANYYQDFASAASIGTFFHQNIKADSTRFPYLKVRDAVTGDSDAQQAA